MANTIHISYPESLAHTLKLNKKDFKEEIKTSSLVKLFELGKISSGTAANVLGVSRLEFLDILSKYQVSVVETDDLDEDVANA